ISRITDQYLAYIRLMQELNFDMASEFLVMAATLLYWKSKAVLPRDQDEQARNGANEDEGPTPEDLIRQMLEHQRFLAAGDDLAQLPRLNEDVFTRQNRKPPVEKIWREMNISDLALGYQDMVIRARKRKTILRKETVSISEKILEFSSKLEVGKITELAKLLNLDPSRPELVVSFLASLEMARMKKLRVHQELAYHPIYLELLEKIEALGLQFTSEFDQPGENASAAESAPAEAPSET